MRVLIVEDNAFNAFCLSRLLQTVNKQLKIKVVSDGCSALRYLTQYEVSLIILDGDLGENPNSNDNGPTLANSIWSKNSQIPIIAWSDSEDMRAAFAGVFKQHNKAFDHKSCWPKAVDSGLVLQALSLVSAHTELNYFLPEIRVIV